MRTPTSLTELFRESVIFQGVLALACIIGTFVLLMFDKPIPDYIWVLNATVIGYFFGARNLLTARNSAQDNAQVAQTLAVQNAQIVKALSTMGIGGAVGAPLHTGWELDDRSAKFERPIEEKL